MPENNKVELAKECKIIKTLDSKIFDITYIKKREDSVIFLISKIEISLCTDKFFRLDFFTQDFEINFFDLPTLAYNQPPNILKARFSKHPTFQKLLNEFNYDPYETYISDDEKGMWHFFNVTCAGRLEDYAIKKTWKLVISDVGVKHNGDKYFIYEIIQMSLDEYQNNIFGISVRRSEIKIYKNELEELLTSPNHNHIDQINLLLWLNKKISKKIEIEPISERFFSSKWFAEQSLKNHLDDVLYLKLYNCD